jgi:hypothetical protein
MRANVAIKTDHEMESSILHVLNYYAAFRYPLKAEEIFRHSPRACSMSRLLSGLEELVHKGKVFGMQGYYASQPDIKSMLLRRKKGNELAKEKIRGAGRAGQLIYRFPFVKFVGISGSLSKGYAEPDSDYDFFIVTEKNRLWICRTLLHVFKKLTFLVGQEHKFCMNYFIDLGKLELEDKNRYTAIELASLTPVKGYAVYNDLMASNGWMNEMLPNEGTNVHIPVNTRESLVKKCAETLLNQFSAEHLNARLMKLTDRRWRKKWTRKSYPAEDYELAFKTTLQVSKNHPANHQKRILQHLAECDPGNNAEYKG